MLQLPCPANAYVKCAFAAVADMRFLEADDQRPKFGKTKPLRHLAAQHAALGIRPRPALAGDDKHKGEAVVMRALQKAEQGPVRPDLGHAMQVEPRIDLAAAF